MLLALAPLAVAAEPPPEFNRAAPRPMPNFVEREHIDLDDLEQAYGPLSPETLALISLFVDDTLARPTARLGRCRDCLVLERESNERLVLDIHDQGHLFCRGAMFTNLDLSEALSALIADNSMLLEEE